MQHIGLFLVFLRNHFFSITIFVLFVLLLGGSYVRFMVQQDYLVSYEGDCDPHTESCYEGCEDDACTETYYYSVIERQAAELYALCGPDISECDAAYECEPGVAICSISYCDPEEEGEDVCVNVTESES